MGFRGQGFARLKGRKRWESCSGARERGRKNNERHAASSDKYSQAQIYMWATVVDAISDKFFAKSWQIVNMVRDT